MQANDTALDFISPLENRSLKTFKAGLALARIFRNAELCGSHDKNWAVLGIADWILDRVPAKNLMAVRPIIDRALRGERTEGKLKGWRNPQERKDALSRFQARLDGIDDLVPDPVLPLLLREVPDVLVDDLIAPGVLRRPQPGQHRKHGAGNILLCQEDRQGQADGRQCGSARADLHGGEKWPTRKS
jgi:hypothetical protein